MKSDKVKIVCKEDCGNFPKKIFLRDFNIAAAKKIKSMTSHINELTAS
jgi:hypothetical protein